jgi:hypothetical protein
MALQPRRQPSSVFTKFKKEMSLTKTTVIVVDQKTVTDCNKQRIDELTGDNRNAREVSKLIHQENY